MADLAEKYFGDRRQYKKFLEYNNIPDINSMKPGDRLQVPVNSNESTNLDQVAPNAEAGKSATLAAESTPTLSVAESTNQTTFDSLQTAEIEAVLELAPPTGVKANDVLLVLKNKELESLGSFFCHVTSLSSTSYQLVRLPCLETFGLHGSASLVTR